MRGISATTIGIGEAVLAVVFGSGLLFWGIVYARFRRTTMLLVGVGAFVVMALRRPGDQPPRRHVRRCCWRPSARSRWWRSSSMSGATPAALGLLADVSEGFEEDRSAIMGLYSVFLGLGQVIGAVVGGMAASWKGIDGLVVATAVLLAIGMLALMNLRAHEDVAVLEAGQTVAAQPRALRVPSLTAGGPR